MRGFTLFEVLVAVFLVSFVGAIVFLTGAVFYLMRQAQDEAYRSGVIEGAYPLAVRECLSGSTAGSVQVNFYDAPLQVDYECQKLGNRLYRLVLQAGNSTRVFYFSE